jgi:hypothetical protein
MSVLGTLEGNGTLLVLDKRYDDIPYAIIVTQRGLIKQAIGTITFPSITVGNAAFQAGSAILQIKGGNTVDLIVTRFGPPNMVAEVAVSGPVPGFS